MLKTIFLTGLVLTVSVLPVLAADVPVVPGVAVPKEPSVTDPAQIEILANLGALIDSISGPVTKCVSEEKLEALVCQCREKDKIIALKTAYDAAIVAHPEWVDAQVNYPTPAEEHLSRTISFAGLKAGAVVPECPQ